MEEPMKEKVKLIVIDKGITAIVVAVVVAIVTFIMNENLENKKTENSLNSGIVKDFITECETDWSKITEIEVASENLISDIRIAYLFHYYKGGDIYSNKDINEKVKKLDKMRNDVYVDIRKKESLLTKDLTMHFIQYLGFQKSIFNAEMELELKTSPNMEKDSLEFIKDIREKLGKMRFDINQAKNMAIILYMNKHPITGSN